MAAVVVRVVDQRDACGVADREQRARGKEAVVVLQRRAVAGAVTQPVESADQTVEGNIVRPEGNYILDRNRNRFESLVRLRPSFERELRASTDGLQR